MTANVCANMDKLFDSLNSDSSDCRRGKPFATNMKENSLHKEHLMKMKSFFQTMKYVGSSRSPPSQNGWVWTINAMLLLWRHLVEMKINSLATRRIQQDPLENLFGCIRGNCGSNVNPTIAQFAAGLKTAVLTNLAHIGTTVGNCETDNNVIINNFDSLLSVSQTPRLAAVTETNDFCLISDDMRDDIEKSLNEDDSEVQACAYVCGFIISKLNTKCKKCEDIFVAKTTERHHMFVESREYLDDKKKLNYASKDMVTCVEICASATNLFFKEKGHVSNMRKNVQQNIEINCDFTFLNACPPHKEENIKKICNCIFMVCVKRFCILKNREFAEASSASALKRKMQIILHK